MACRFCQNFLIKSILTEDYKHQPSLSALRLSSLDGCDLCRLIWDSYFAEQSAFGQAIVATDDSSAVRIKSLASAGLQRDFLNVLGLVGEPETIRVTFGDDGEGTSEWDDLSLNLVAYEGLFRLPFSEMSAERNR